MNKLIFVFALLAVTACKRTEPVTTPYSFKTNVPLVSMPGGASEQLQARAKAKSHCAKYGRNAELTDKAKENRHSVGPTEWRCVDRPYRLP